MTLRFRTFALFAACALVAPAAVSAQDKTDDSKGWVALAVDMKPNFTDDLSPLPAAGHSALWTYRAIYLLNDADFGQWSDAVSVTVAG